MIIKKLIKLYIENNYLLYYNINIYLYIILLSWNKLKKKELSKK